MDKMMSTTLVLSIVLIAACTPRQSPQPPPPQITVFDPLTKPMERARGVEKTVDQGAVNERKTLDTQERGDTTP